MSKVPLKIKEKEKVEMKNVKRNSVIPAPVGSRENGAVVRALASHQCGLASIPRLGVICGLSLLLVLVLAPRGFSSGTPAFPSPPAKTNISNSISISAGESVSPVAI